MECLNELNLCLEKWIGIMNEDVTERNNKDELKQEIGNVYLNVGVKACTVLIEEMVFTRAW